MNPHTPISTYTPRGAGWFVQSHGQKNIRDPNTDRALTFASKPSVSAYQRSMF